MLVEYIRNNWSQNLDPPCQADFKNQEYPYLQFRSPGKVMEEKTMKTETREM